MASRVFIVTGNRCFPKEMMRRYVSEGYKDYTEYTIEERIYSHEEVEALPEAFHPEFVACYNEHKELVGYRMLGPVGKYCPSFQAANGVYEFLEPEERRCGWCVLDNLYGPYGCPERFRDL